MPRATAPGSNLLNSPSAPSSWAGMVNYSIMFINGKYKDQSILINNNKNLLIEFYKFKRMQLVIIV